MKEEELGEIGRETGDEVKASLTRKGKGGKRKSTTCASCDLLLPTFQRLPFLLSVKRPIPGEA